MPFFSTPEEQNSHIHEDSQPPLSGGLANIRVKRRIRTFFLYLATAVVIVLGAAIFYFNFAKSSEAVWYNDEYSYRQRITFGNTGAADSNKKVKFDVDTASLTTDKLQADCDDIRFTDINGKFLRFYLDSAGGACDTASSDYYVLVPTINSGNTILYMYYGNPTAVNAGESAQFSEATFTPTSGPTFASEEKGPSPVLYWKFNDGTGTTAQDSSVQNNDGTTSGPSWEAGGVAAGKGEFSLKFDGSNDLVSKSYSTDTELNPGTANMSVSVWFRHSSTISGTDTLISRASGTLGSEVGYKLYMNSSGYICFGIDDTAGSFPADSACSTATQGSYADSKWHFAEAVKNGTSTITLFIDGQQITQTAVTATLTISGSSPTFYVGIDSDGASNPWTGFIDEVKVFTSEQSVRSAAQVKADFTARSTADGASAVLGQDTSQTNLVSGLVGWWKMDESSGNAADSSGNALTLTNNGTTTFTTGKFSNASNHNGTTQYFSTATTISGVQTIAFWVNPASTTDDYINLIASITYINSSSGTVSATGFTSPSIYVNGVLNGSVTASVWNHVAVTTNTGISATAFEAGRANGSYLDNTGKIDEVRVYNRALSEVEVRALYSFAPGPVGWWKMDENTGSITNDSSGYGKTSSTFTGNTSWVPGKYGSALTFDGADDVVRFTEASQIDLGATTDSYTLQAWIKTTSCAITCDVVEKMISSSTAYPYRLFIDSNNITYFRIRDSSGNTPNAQKTLALNDGSWHFLVGVRNVNTDTLYLYIDSILQNSVNDTTTASTDNNDDVSIGNGGASYINNDFNGQIDDVRVYNYARSPSQIVEDMNAGHPAPGSPVGSPVGYWKIDEGYLTNVNDTSENNNDLTMNSASWATAGKFNKAWNGTGSLWIAQAADDADFDFAAAEDFSLSMWFKSDSATNPSSGADQFLIGKGTITNTGTRGYTIYADDNGKINFGICGNADTCAWGASSPGTPSPNDTATSTSDIYDGSWHHIVATKTGTSRIDLYVDGRLNASDTSLTATGSLANSIVLRVGDDDSDATNSFAGDIDEVKIFRLALTSDQVKQDFNRGQAVVYGALSTDSTGAAASNSYSREFCVPGDTATCNPPVGEWRMEEASWTNDCSTDTVFDSSGNGFAADSCPSSTGPLGGTVGKIGKGGTFDGTDDYVNAGDISSKLNLVSATPPSFTVSAWMNATSGTGVAGGISLVCNTSACPISSNGPNYYARLFYASNNGDFRFQLRTVETVVDTSPASYGSWYYVTGVYNQSENLIKIYLNGVFQAQATPSSTDLSGKFNRLIIGNAQYPFKGQLDEVRIYDYALSQAQVSYLYNRGKPVGHWKLDECQGTTANDSAGNSLSGTISAGAAGITSVGDCTTASTMWDNGESGKWNYSLDFDAIDDSISITNASAIDFDTGLNNGFTYASWIYADSAGESNVGRFFDKGTNTYCRTDNPQGSNLDIECQLDLTTTDRNVNVSAAVTTGSWNHVAFVWTNDSDDDVTVYINGKSRGSSSTNSNDTIPADTNNLTIGNNSAGSATFDGKIDDVRVYNYEMTATQIKTLYNQDAAVRYGPVTGAP